MTRNDATSHAPAAGAEPEAHAEKHAHDHGTSSRAELVLAVAAGVLLLAGWLTERFAGESTVSWLLFVAAYIAGGYFAVIEAFHNLRERKLQIDALMLVAAAGAAALGQWPEGALLLFLFSLGHALESYAMGRARRAIEALGELRPATALVRRDGRDVELPVGEIEAGDVVIVKPDERIAVDGFVILGTTSIDQSAITGESVPADKAPVANRDEARDRAQGLPAEHRVFAGSIHRERAIEIEAPRRADDSTLSRIIELVRSAEATKSPTQLFTDRFQRLFVPAVLLLAIVLMFAWVVIDEPFSASFYRAMAVLVAASPCALAISTPSAVLSGIARAARGGVLIKGGGPLENLGILHALAFDKTGTLTEGNPRVTDIAPVEGIAESDFLAVTVAVERLSDHPLAVAVVRDASERLGNTPIPAAHDIESLTGRGVRATVAGDRVYLGKKLLFGEVEGDGIPTSLAARVNDLEAQGRTVFVVRRGNRYLGAIGLMDTPRASARAAIGDLRALGMRTMVMLSGDNERVAKTIAAEVGIERAIGDLMPQDKVNVVRQLRRDGEVAMVGDGVNDAPALAAASVGIAMGAAGSDVALETADVALMGDRLEQLPFVVGLSRQARRIIRQNLWASLGMVAFLIPATIIGMPMGVAVLFHEGSTLLVVANALRLLAFPDAPHPKKQGR